MEPLNYRLLHHAVHPLDLAVRLGVRGLGKALLNALPVAELADRVVAYPRMVGQAVKLDTVVSQ